MKILKYTTISVATLIVLVMVVATFIESSKGATFVADHIYGASWFVALWAVLTATSITYILKMKLYRKAPVFLLHASFMVILAGALTSWLTSKSGTVHLRQGEQASSIKLNDNTREEMGFTLQLKDFEITYYPGTDAPMDYTSTVSADGHDIHISMNHIGEHRGYRFTQSGYDSDMQGTTLGVLYDPYGITITYIGYGLLLIAIILTLLSKRTRMRDFYKKAVTSQVARTIAIAILTGASITAHAADDNLPTVNKQLADDFGRVCVLYNSRICPVNTVATSFVTKLTGKASWHGYSADEIFMGWAFNAVQWENAKMIQVKDKEAQRVLGIDNEWAAVSDFWDGYNEYKLERPLKEAAERGDLQMQKHLRDADEKFNIVRMFYNGEMLRIFPCPDKNGRLTWLSPGEKKPQVTLPEKELFFVSKAMDYLAESVIMNDDQRAALLIDKIGAYQRVKAQGVMPSKAAVEAELVSNTLNSLRWPVITFLAVALLLVVGATLRLPDRAIRLCQTLSYTLLALMTAYTTVLLALRWYVSGHLPMSNGYETMQFMAWTILLLTLLLQHKFKMVLRFGPLLSAFALLVSMINGGNPQITQLMPVLQSPLLSLHVMVIMFAYSLFALMALTSLQGLVEHSRHHEERSASLAAFSQMLLYPAVFLLTTGIFIGAVWANVSWGRYWGWDSKEVWALITMMVYAAPLHGSIRWMQKPLHIHIYILLSFLVVLMTYFGVNYFLPGLHSYANV